ncbi:MAG: hypothetical protein AAGB15_04710 [Pseudomonadota bacterium]
MLIEPQTRTSRDMERYEIVRGYIEHEDSLINQRITWSLAANSFLLIALALTGSALGNLSTSAAGAKAASALFSDTQIRALLVTIMQSIPLVGAAICTVTALTVLAAIKALESLKRTLTPEECRALGLPSLTGGGSTMPAYVGYAAIMIPAGLVAFWMAIRWSIV